MIFIQMTHVRLQDVSLKCICRSVKEKEAIIDYQKSYISMEHSLKNHVVSVRLSSARQAVIFAFGCTNYLVHLVNNCCTYCCK